MQYRPTPAGTACMWVICDRPVPHLCTLPNNIASSQSSNAIQAYSSRDCLYMVMWDRPVPNLCPQLNEVNPSQSSNALQAYTGCDSVHVVMWCKPVPHVRTLWNMMKLSQSGNASQASEWSLLFHQIWVELLQIVLGAPSAFLTCFKGPVLKLHPWKQNFNISSQTLIHVWRKQYSLMYT